MVHLKMLACALALTISFSFALPTMAVAQTFRGGINGSVTDATGAVLPQALLTATNEATGFPYKTASSSAGEFSFQDLPPRTYLIEFTASGFQKTEFKNVIVLAGKIHTLDGKLNVATQPSTVEVSAATVSLDTTTASDDTVLSSQTVQDIPINGRDFTQLVDQSAAFSGYMAVGSVNGTRSTDINWQIDGADNNDPWGNMVSVNQVGVGGDGAQPGCDAKSRDQVWNESISWHRVLLQPKRILRRPKSLRPAEFAQKRPEKSALWLFPRRPRSERQDLLFSKPGRAEVFDWQPVALNGTFGGV